MMLNNLRWRGYHRGGGRGDVGGITATDLLVAAVAAMGVHGQYTTNLTADEWSYAAAVGVRVVPVMDTTVLVDERSGAWEGSAFADNVGKVFAAPYSSDAVLIFDPVTNATDVQFNPRWLRHWR